MVFRDRRDAGRQLAAQLERLAAEDPVVLALPRGGVPVAFEVARALHAPMDVLAVRKIGAPGIPELGVGAIAEDGTAVLDQATAQHTGMTQELLDQTVEREQAELARRVQTYRRGRSAIAVEGRTVIIVDDGVATGVTDLAAVRAVRARGAAKIVLAVPVGARKSIRMLREEADEVVCVSTPPDFRGVGRWYRDFAQVSDHEVLVLLGRANATPATPATHRSELTFALDGMRLGGEICAPPEPRGLVLFAHGSGSSRHSPRNIAVARRLRQSGLATLLFDLLDEREALRRDLVFNIPLLASRLEAVTVWVREQRTLADLTVGYFGASTGAAAALVAAANLGSAVQAIVARGGRPDLAGDHLAAVQAPTLLIVGGRDRQVLELNRQAAAELQCPHELAVVPDAGHLFEERGALEAVARHASDWFAEHLAAAPVGA